MKLSFFSALVAASTAAAHVVLHPGAASNKCLEVRGNVRSPGTPVQIYECNKSAAQLWELQLGTTSVKLANSEYCLDAGYSPGPHTLMKIEKCSDNSPGQTWSLTSDNRIALLGKHICLDLPNGNLKDATVVQTFHCTKGDQSQIWLSS